jgi:hypothetical protein
MRIMRKMFSVSGSLIQMGCTNIYQKKFMRIMGTPYFMQKIVGNVDETFIQAEEFLSAFVDFLEDRCHCH